MFMHELFLITKVKNDYDCIIFNMDVAKISSAKLL